MYQYSNETQLVIRGMVEASQPFDLEDIKVLTETLLEDDGKYFDPIVTQDLKAFLLTLFERGHMPGYCLTTEPICDEEGPKMNIEFIPENLMASLDLINKPGEGGQSVTCVLHPQYKEFLKYICLKAECSQDTMVRSILIKALDQIRDQMK